MAKPCRVFPAESSGRKGCSVAISDCWAGIVATGSNTGGKAANQGLAVSPLRVFGGVHSLNHSLDRVEIGITIRWAIENEE